MATVRIPESHFIKNARRQYRDPDTTLVREALQNSLDAGATHVEFEFGDDSFQVTDNGCGMTAERMVEALLTLSGTSKPAGAVGGFGAAKVVVRVNGVTMFRRWVETAVWYEDRLHLTLYQRPVVQDSKEKRSRVNHVVRGSWERSTWGPTTLTVGTR